MINTKPALFRVTENLEAADTSAQATSQTWLHILNNKRFDNGFSVNLGTHFV